MPKAKKKQKGPLDTWGRRNRKIMDKRCQECGKVYRPKRETSKYCSRSCMWKNNGGHNRKEGPIWWVDGRGYISGRVWVNGKRVRVRQHRWILEQHLKRPLLRSETVHHINDDRQDNRIENLEIMTHGEHSRKHNKAREYKKGYKMNLSDKERTRRSEAMSKMRRDKATGKVVEDE